MPAPSRAVFGSARPAMLHVGQHGERLTDDLMQPAAFHVHDHADAAHVVLADQANKECRVGVRGSECTCAALHVNCWVRAWP